ncbi:MAG TPA: UDP-N-acetylmuramate dehydrogenase [Candidatus Binatia bacterium]|nr:UDP-N-acetylmuramate dehydrogenase [Candidatus Binatia bacterium]
MTTPATIAPELLAELQSRLGDRARPAEPLARHTSFRIGGPADVLAVPDTPAELGHVLRTAVRFDVRVVLLGGGSNVLVGDGGMRGVVVKLGRGFARIAWEAERDSVAGSPNGRPVLLTAGAAVQLGRLARAAVARGLAGLEYAEGIPGTVGGALFMNAGAYGGEVAETVDAVEGVDARTGDALALDGDALAFRYRRAELPRGFVVTAVRFRLRRDDAERAEARMADVRAHRVASQPHGRANAGSIFKNPPGDHAGRLIEAVGLKGMRAGRARISERHANFIVNEGGARAVEVKALMDLAQRVVWERSGVWLEPEVQLVGTW